MFQYRASLTSFFLLAFMLLPLSLWTANASAAKIKIPNAHISLDDGFAFDMNTNGDYVLAWSPEDNTTSSKVLRGSTLTGQAQRWSVPHAFSTEAGVAIAADGTMALSWTEDRDNARWGTRVKYGAVWKASDTKIVPHAFATSHSDIFDDLGRVDVAINSTGVAAFAWESGYRGERISFATGRSDSRFTPVQRIVKDSRPGLLHDPEVSIDDAGAVMVRWEYLGLNCREAWFVPKNCRNQPSSLSYAHASADLQFTPPRRFGKACEWAQSDQTTRGQMFAIALCRTGFKYVTATSGEPLSGLQPLPILDRDSTSSPSVKIFQNGRVIVAYESLRFPKKGGPYSLIGGSTGAFGGPLGPPRALTAEIDYSDAEMSGGDYGGYPLVLEGPGSQPYVAIIGVDTNTIAALNTNGQLGPSLRLPAGGDSKVGVSPDGIGFAFYTTGDADDKRFWETLWMSSFPLPSP